MTRRRLSFLILLLTLMATTALMGQTTTVTLNAGPDGDGQTWNNGTWNATLIPASNAITGPFFVLGTTTPVPNQIQSGSLGAGGSATLTLNSNNQIAPAGTVWAITVCPAATSPCFTSNQTIIGATQTVGLTPPAIRINLTGVPYRVLAYLDTEIASPQQGSLYYNLTSACMKLYTGSWNCLGIGAGGTVTSVSQSTGITTTPNPIVGSGTIAITASYQLPQSCTTNQYTQWNGSAWVCVTPSSLTAVVGEALVGATASTAVATPAAQYASQFTAGGANDYCTAVNLAFQAAPQGAVVYGDLTGIRHCTQASAAAMLSNCNNGYLRGQDTQLYIDVVAGSLPMIPIPNKCGGIRGIGRADQGGAGLVIIGCKAAGSGSAQCAAPTTRAGTINSMTPSGNYVHVNYTLTTGPPGIGGEGALIFGIKEISLINTNNTVIAGSAGSQTVTFTVANTTVVGENYTLTNLTGTQSSKLNGMLCNVTVASGTAFTCPLVNTPNRSVTNATESNTKGLADLVNNDMGRICQLSSKSFTSNTSSATYTLTSGNVFTYANGTGTPTFVTGEVIVLTQYTGSDAFLNGQYISVTSVSAGGFVAQTYFAHGATSGGNGKAATAPVNTDSACPANPTLTDFYVVNPLAASTGAVGTVEFGTGLVGISTSTGAAGTFGFAQRLEDMSVVCNGVEGLIGYMNYAGEEQSGNSHLLVSGCTFMGWDIHTNFAQNTGTYFSNEIYVNVDSCHEGTLSIFIGDSGIAGLNKITFSANACGAGTGTSPEPNNGIRINGGFMEIRGQIHCEGLYTCIEIGQDAVTTGVALSTVGSQPTAFSGNTGIDVSGNFCSAGTSDITLEVVKLNTGALDTYVDHCQQDGAFFNNDAQFAFLAWDINGTLENRLTTSTTSKNIIEGGLSYFRPVSPHTASYALLLSDSDTILTNEGAAGSITFTMPACNATNVGTHYYFEVDAAFSIVIAHTQKFRLGGFLSAANPNITGATQGSRLGEQCIHSTADAIFEWLVTDLNTKGSWTIGAGPLLGSGSAGVASTITLATTTVAAATCNTNTFTIEGVLTTSAISWSLASVPTGVGYTSNPITIYVWPSAANTISVSQCNANASTPTGTLAATSLVIKVNQ